LTRVLLARRLIKPEGFRSAHSYNSHTSRAEFGTSVT
jgi:hypothetical protein